MEEQDHTEKIDDPKNISLTDNLLADDFPDPVRSASQSPFEPEKKTPSLSQRFAEAFREGLASAKPNSENRPVAKAAPPAPKNRQSSVPPELLEWVIQGGKSVAAGIGESASSLADSIANLAKKAPSFPTKWGEAFREGSAKVRAGEVKPKTEPVPSPPGSPTAVGKGPWDSVSQIGDSAAGFVRDALVTFKPGEVQEIEKKIRLGEKKIKDLYVEIGREAADSWNCGGAIETEKVGTLLDEFWKQEDIIRKLRAPIPEIAPGKKAEANGSSPVAQEALFTPAGLKEDSHPIVEVSAPNPDQPVDPPEDRQEPARPEAGMILSATPEVESLAGPSAPDYPVEAEPAPREEVSAGADQTLSTEPEAARRKRKAVLEK